MAVNEFVDRHRATRWFYFGAAAFFAVAILLGFGQTYYFKPFFDSPPIPSTLVHLHGLVMTAWVALVAVQVFLISSKRIRIHQKLGYAGIALAATLLVVGFMTGVAAAKRGSTVPGIEPLPFLIIPLGDLLVFAVLFGAAVYYRKQAATHKRLILLTILNFLPPALGRFPAALSAELGPLWFYGVPDLIAIVLVIADTWKHRRLNKMFLAGALFMIASHPLRLMFSNTPTWIGIAEWLTR
jgi:hypothetical protein